MKKAFLSIFVIIAVAVACKTSQQKTAFNTLATIEGLGTAAVDSYYFLVIQGKLPTNGVAAVTKKYDAFQDSVRLALDAVQFNTNALAPGALVLESQDLVNLITTLKKGQK